MPSASPSAAAISVAETLELLTGRFETVAKGVADGRYVFWLGSGISKERVPDLRELVLKVLGFLHMRITTASDCPHLMALRQAVDLARLSDDEKASLDVRQPPATWSVADRVVDGLRDRYSEMLDIRVNGQDADYLLWEAVDVRETYGRGIEPDCAHLCIAILVLEGVLREISTSNWDGLIETAIANLSGDPDLCLKVVVLPIELRAPERQLTLVKFHGCAVLARRDPGRYRSSLVGMRSQITAWNTSAATKPIRDSLVSLATTKRTLMVGLSAQDENIQRLFAEAQDSMAWPWPTDPPAHVFADDSLGQDHTNILRVVYGETYNSNSNAIEHGALIRAYAEPLLIALVLFVLAEKMRTYLAEVDAPSLSSTDRDQLSEGLAQIANRLAAAAEPDRLRFIQAMVERQNRALSCFQDGQEPAPATGYRPVGNIPVDRVRTDAALATGGVRELAAAVAILGRGEAAGIWNLSVSSTAAGALGAVNVTRGSTETAIFFAANARAAVQLEYEGIVDPDAADVVVIHSTGPLGIAVRTPRARYGRSGRVGSRDVDMFELLQTAQDLSSLEVGFREAAVL